MNDLHYHGRRAVDEVLRARNAATPEVASAHKQLSLLHLDRFNAMVMSAADLSDQYGARRSG